jgi:hypothetical protein
MHACHVILTSNRVVFFCFSQPKTASTDWQFKRGRGKGITNAQSKSLKIDIILQTHK